VSWTSNCILFTSVPFVILLTSYALDLCTLELGSVKKELKEEQEKNASIQSELTHYSITKAELKRTTTLLTEQMKVAEQIKVEAAAAKLSQGIIAKSLEELTQRAKAAEIAKAKLEHNTEASKTALENLKAEYNKLLHRSNAV